MDLDRVQEARRRLETADATTRNSDASIRIVELHSPRVGEAPLELDRGFCVLASMSGPARQALAATIDAVRTNNEHIGLAGVVESYGRRSRMHQQRVEPKTAPGTSLVPTLSIFGRSAHTEEIEQLHEVIETIDRAVLLSSAELRGADAAAAALDAELAIGGSTAGVRASTDIELYSPTNPLTDDQQVLAALDSVALPVEQVDLIRKAVAALRADTQRTRLQAACSQAAAARSQVQPTDGQQVNMMAELAVAEADGTLAEYDMEPGSSAETLTRQLAEIGIDATAFTAPEIADRIIGESEELESIRARLITSIESVANSPEVERLTTERRDVERQRLRITRRLRSQQQLLAVARDESTRLGFDQHTLDLRDAAERPTPILIEDPLDDLPARLSGAILSTLLRHSAQTQVICVSDQLDLRQWCNSVGDRAGWVQASGWFAGRNEC